MNRQVEITRLRAVVGIAIALMLGTNEFSVGQSAERTKVTYKVPDQLRLAKLGDVHLGGKIGQELDLLVDKRIASDFAVNEIAPEATRAFETRMDDQFHEGRGLWQGEFWGKWILSAVAAYQYTGDEQIKNAIRRETTRLMATQDKDGYIGSYKNSAYVSGDVWNVWNQKYALWGLVEAYQTLGDPAVLTAAQRMMDHLMTQVGPGKVEMVNTGNFYGLPSSSILTPLVKLYRYSGEKKYLDYAQYIVQNWELVPGSPPAIVQKGLTRTPVHEWFPDKGKWTKAYEFISCVEGLVDLYQVVGNEDYLRAAKNIFASIQENERVITGGIGYHDKLVGASLKPTGLNEPCDVVYWERLATKLLTLTGDQRYANEIERLSYNVLVGSISANGEWGLRRMGLNEPHLVSPLHCFTKNHQCCVANVPRGLLQLGEVTVMADRTMNNLLVNLYIPGTYQLLLSDGKTVGLTVDTPYPKTGDVALNVQADKPFTGRVSLRIPDWCNDFQVSVNGQAVKNQGTDKSVFSVNQTWKNGDAITVTMGMPARLIAIPEEGVTYKAIMRGPLVLARCSWLEPVETMDQPVALDAGFSVTPVSDAQKSPHVWLEFEGKTSDGQTITLCDYVSTGKEYDKPQDPTDWEGMIKNQVKTVSKVWMKAKK